MKLTKKHIPAILLALWIIWVLILFARVPLEEPSELNPYDELEANLSFQLATVESQLLEDYAQLHDSHELYKSKKAELAMVRQLQANWWTTGHIKPVYNVVEAKEPVEETVVVSEPMRLVWHDGRSKPLPPVYWNTKEQRFINFVRYYARWFDESVFVKAREQYWVPEEILACIARAETTLGNANKSTNNIMNYWNNDRGDVVHKDNVQQNVYYTAHWLTQGLLSNNTILAELSWAGRDKLGLPWCAESGEYCYATSWPKGYWRVNVHNCLTFIEWEKKDWDNMRFRK